VDEAVPVDSSRAKVARDGAGDDIAVDGVGLHTGERARVVLRRAPGPVRIRARGVEATLAELRVVASARATTVEPRGGGFRVCTVEHALAALAGLGVHDGVTLDVDGPEMPLLDGGAALWCEALRSLSLVPSAPRLRVTRAATYDVGPSRYVFDPGPRPPGEGPRGGALHSRERGASGADRGPSVSVSVRVDFGLSFVATTAAWHGDPADFAARIAPARTFALAREVDELARRGLARHVDPACVLVLSSDAILHAGRPPAPDEPARHKLLDLLGDFHLHGGPAVGRVHAVRPGHAANVRAFRRALDAGVLAPVG
jgi:UDP-3-O-[3-hydroxymyristoyl] N-acetylglucosamine deacetylase